jgi:hypothetical protein
MRSPAKLLAIIAAGGALAVGVPAALAATDAPETANTPVQSATPTPDQARGDDCPEKHGRGGAEETAPAAPAAPDAPTATPEV